MPDITLDAQPFDLAFHPTTSTVYAGLLSGLVQAVSYDHAGRYEHTFSLKLSNRSIRSISLTEDGAHMYAVGKGKALFTIDTNTGKELNRRVKAHSSSINCVQHMTNWLLATGDDDGVVKLWDPRTRDHVRTYDHHFDYITDFLWLSNPKQLVTTSADATLSVIDVRSKTTKPLAQSEDQEDELLAIAPIKGGTKFLVGTQLGILSVFDRKKGWSDCVDRIPGHPQSIDALCCLPESLPGVDSSSTILTGSSDGMVRAVDIFPTSLREVAVDLGEWPVECIAVSDADEAKPIALDGSSPKAGMTDKALSQDLGRWWMAVAGQDNVLKLSSLAAIFVGAGASGDASEEENIEEESEVAAVGDDHSDKDQVGDTSDSEPELEPEPVVYQKKKRKAQDPFGGPTKKGKNEIDTADTQFFDAL